MTCHTTGWLVILWSIVGMLFGLAASVLVLDVSFLLISADFDSIFETIHSSVDVKFSAHFQTSRVLRSPLVGVNIDNCCRYITVRLLCSYIVTTRLLLSSYDSTPSLFFQCYHYQQVAGSLKGEILFKDICCQTSLASKCRTLSGQFQL